VAVPSSTCGMGPDMIGEDCTSARGWVLTGAIVMAIGGLSLALGWQSDSKIPPTAVAVGRIAEPQVACRGCGRVYAIDSHVFCPICDQRLAPASP
jgi:hypothetical protein